MKLILRSSVYLSAVPCPSKSYIIMRSMKLVLNNRVFLFTECRDARCKISKAAHIASCRSASMTMCISLNSRCKPRATVSAIGFQRNRAADFGRAPLPPNLRRGFHSICRMFNHLTSIVRNDCLQCRLCSQKKQKTN